MAHAETMLKMMVVEDNPLIRDLVRHGVNRLQREQGANIELFETADGATAWSRILENEFDLVLVDLYIPVLDGLELIKRIRENDQTHGIPILGMSASYTDAEDRCLGAGADRFIQKPLRAEELLLMLRALLHLQAPKSRKTSFP